MIKKKGRALRGPSRRLQGLDSNQRPSGYEPDELPLLHPATKSVSKNPGKGLSSHGVAPIVLSALRRFTTVFGTGTGGSTALYHQGIFNALGVPFLRARP